MKVSEIINRYQSGEGLESVARSFGVGKLKIKKILNDNDITIRSRGNIKKYKIPKNLPELYIPCKSGFKIVAKCKASGKIFDDYQNKSGALTAHLKKLNIPTLSYYDAKKYYGETGKHWFIKYFDFDEVELTDVIKCDHCDWVTSDVDNKSGAMIKHLKNEHGIEPEVLSNDESTKCVICGERLRMINNTHLKKHGITLSEYKLKYPTAKIVSNQTSDKLRTLAKDNQKLFKNSFKSKAETTIFQWISKHIPDVKQGDRSTLNGVELDIVIPSKMMAIEYNGLKYHTEWFGGKDKWYHLNKQKLCNERGYNLIHIYEDEWEVNPDIVKSKLSHLLGFSDSIKIGGRSCNIMEIDKPIAKDFINENHIQGYGKTSVRLGAYYGDVLVGVMTFTDKGGNQYELSRFCTHLDYSVYGLGSKMLKYFVRNYKPNQIISFADRCWTMNPLDNLYTKMGFKYSGSTNPDYRYYNSSVDRLRRFHKFGFRKQNLVSKYPDLNLSMTETEMVKHLGYDCIWNCGLFIYIFTT